MKQIAWITSYPKSGNTWMRTILAKALFNNNDINTLTELVPSFNHLLQDTFGGSKTVTVDKVLAGWDELQRFIAKQNTGNKVILKTHNVSGILNKVTFPNEDFTYKAIYLVRDPRDVLLSWAEHRGKTLEQTQKDMFNPRFNLLNEHQSSYSREFISSWDNHVNGWLRSNTETLFVKYEDLLDQTSEHIAKVLDFLKIEPVCSLDEIVNCTSFDALKAQENTVGFKEKAQGVSFFRKGVKNGWQDHDWDFSELEEKFAPVMEKFGYL